MNKSEMNEVWPHKQSVFGLPNHYIAVVLLRFLDVNMADLHLLLSENSCSFRAGKLEVQKFMICSVLFDKLHYCVQRRRSIFLNAIVIYLTYIDL